jgi:hypothetical protein
MAIVQRNILDKYMRYAKKSITLHVEGLRLSAIKGRFTGPKVLLVSVPKSGTHMLEGILEKMPLLRNSCWKTINNGPSSFKKINRLGNGMFANSHLYYNKELRDLLMKNNIKVIFMIRDPRDIVVSKYKYFTDIEHTHDAHKQLLKAASDSERLMLSIKGIDNIIPGIKQALSGFKEWLHVSDVLTVRFEELVGDRGNGSSELRRQCISNISSFLDLNLTAAEIDKLDSLLINKDSSTRRRGIIGGWKQEFKQDHISFFERELKPLMQEYGYNDL